MKWIVIGADRETGEDKAIEIEADNEESAKRRGNRAGLLVAEARPAVEAIEVDDDPADDAAAWAEQDDGSQHAHSVSQAAPIQPSAVAAATSYAAAAPTMAYQSPPAYQPAGRKPPAYSGLSIASTVLMVVAALAYLAGLLVFCFMIFALIKGPSTPSSPFAASADQAAEMALLGTSLAMFAAGAMYHGMSAACVALRDIAQNSFR